MTVTRSAPVAAPLARVIAEALHRSNRLADAAQLLDRWQRDGSGPGDLAGDLAHELASLCTAEGDHDRALTLLRQAVQSRPDHAGARRLLGETLRYLAGQCVAARDWDRARALVEQARRLDPDDGPLRDAALALEGAGVASASDQHDLNAAVEWWEAVRRADWESPRATHELALLYHRRAIEADGRRRSGPASGSGRDWELAIANWAALLADDRFWDHWIAQRGAAYGAPVAAAQAERLRRDGVRTQLEKVHRDFEQVYIRAGKSGDAERHREYRALLDREIRAARACRETIDLLVSHGQPVSLPIAAGRLLLEHLDLAHEAREAVRLARRLGLTEDGPKQLGLALSPASDARALAERGQPVAALDRLRQAMDADPLDTDVREAFVEIALEQGIKQAVGGSPRPGFALIREARDHVRAGSSEHDALIDRVVTACLTRGAELTDADDDAAIALLDAARSFANDRRLATRLATALNSKGVDLANDAVERSNADDHAGAARLLTQAIELLERANTVEAGNPVREKNLTQAREALTTVRIAQAQQAISAGHPERAIDLLTDILAASPGNAVARQTIALACNQYGVSMANDATDRAQAGDHFEACRLLRRAEEVLSIGVEYAGDQRQIRDNLRKVQQVRAALGC